MSIDNNKIVWEFYTPEEPPPEWASLAPSGRSWHVRRLPPHLSHVGDGMAFDTSVVPSSAAWYSVWKSAEKAPGSPALVDEATLKRLRPALIAAFVPYLHDLAEQHHLARNDSLIMDKAFHRQYNQDGSPLDPNQHRDAARYLKLVDKAVENLVRDALSVSLFDTVIETVCQNTTASPEDRVFPRTFQGFTSSQGADIPNLDGLDVVPLWSKLPAISVGQEIVKAAFKYRRYENTTTDSVHALNVLADIGPHPLYFWGSWAHEVSLFTDRAMQGMEASSHSMAHAIAFHLATMTRRPAIVEISAEVLKSTFIVLGLWLNSSAWRYFGNDVGSALKRHTPRFGVNQEAIFAIAPTAFWLGVRKEVKYTSKTGRWINDRILATAQADPSGQDAQALCFRAWLNLDKNEILDMEAALPGISRRHLPDLAVALQKGHCDSDDVVNGRETSHANWAKPTFKQAGISLNEPDVLIDWAKNHPSEMVGLLLALWGQLEGEALNVTLNEVLGDQKLAPKVPIKRL